MSESATSQCLPDPLPEELGPLEDRLAASLPRLRRHLARRRAVGFTLPTLVLLQGTAVRRAEPLPQPSSKDAPPGAELRIHDVRRLTGHNELAGLEAELLRTPVSEAPAALERLAHMKQQVESTALGLIETVRDQIKPPLAAFENLLELGGGRLALVGLPEQHRWLEGFLAGAATFEVRCAPMKSHLLCALLLAAGCTSSPMAPSAPPPLPAGYGTVAALAPHAPPAPVAEPRSSGKPEIRYYVISDA